jgi:hypothetical protein
MVSAALGIGHGLEMVALTALAEGPFTRKSGKPLTTSIRVPVERIVTGPVGGRLALRVRAPGADAPRPISLSVDRNEWCIDDQPAPSELEELLADSRFLAQHVYAVATATLQAFEITLGRRMGWASGHRLVISVYDTIPYTSTGYDRERGLIRFGHRTDERSKRSVPLALYHDLVAHEVTHAVLDGYRRMWTDSDALLDGYALHECIADVVAMLSVFSSPERVEQQLSVALPGADGKRGILRARNIEKEVLASGLFGLADGLFSRGAARRPLDTDVPFEWRLDPEPHRRGEIAVKAVLDAVVKLWQQRLERPGGRSSRYQVAEAGAQLGHQMLGMVLRGLAYMPPVDPGWEDLLRGILAADAVLVPTDMMGYRQAIRDAFWDIDLAADPDELLDGLKHLRDLRYPVRLSALAADPEEINRFMWENPRLIEAAGIDQNAGIVVNRVRPSTRVGPDGFVVSEIGASYVQSVTMSKTEARNKLGLRVDSDYYTVRGGGLLRFDEGGRLCFAALKPVMDAEWQQEKLEAIKREAGIRMPAATFHREDERTE